MIKKVVTYDSLFDSTKIVETLYFHIYEQELIQWLMEEGMETLPTQMRAIVEAEDWPKVIALFKRIIAMGYGERNGEEFTKNKEITDKFVGSAAYNALFMELMQNSDSSTEFFNGMFPADLMARAQAAVESEGSSEATLQSVTLKTTAVPGVGAGVPQKPMTPARAVELSGLDRPYGNDNELLPWAFREPTNLEGATMTQAQMVACFKRKTAGWEPPEAL